MSQNVPNVGHLITTNESRDAIHVAIVPMKAYQDLDPGEHVGIIEGHLEVAGVTNSPIGIVDPFLTKMVKEGQSFWLFLYQGTVTSLRHEWEHPAFPTQAKQSFWKAAGEEAKDFWKTLEIVRMCEGMRESKDYSALPILADALEEAGFPDTKLSQKCRDYRDVYGLGLPSRVIGRVLGGDIQDSIDWLTDFASEAQMSFDAFMVAAQEFLRTGEMHYLSFDTPDRAYSETGEMWRHYNIVTGYEVEDKGVVFRCGC